MYWVRPVSIPEQMTLKSRFILVNQKQSAIEATEISDSDKPNELKLHKSETRLYFLFTSSLR